MEKGVKRRLEGDEKSKKTEKNENLENKNLILMQKI